jgi:hypothetical protein
MRFIPFVVAVVVATGGSLARGDTGSVPSTPTPAPSNVPGHSPYAFPLVSPGPPLATGYDPGAVLQSIRLQKRQAETQLAAIHEQLAALQAADHHDAAAPEAESAAAQTRLVAAREAIGLKAVVIQQEAIVKQLDEQQQEEQRLQNEIAGLSQRVDALQQAARERSPVTITVLDGQTR